MNAYEDELNRYHRLAQMGRIGWWEADFSTREYLCSDFVRDLLGLDSNRISFSAFREMIREDFRESMVEELPVVEHRNVGYEHVFPLETPNGDTIWVMVRMGKKETDDEGVQKAFGTMQQVEAPEQKEILFKNIFDNIPVGVEIYDAHARLIDLNDKDMEMFGVENKHEMLGIDLLHNPNLSDELERRIAEEDEVNARQDYFFDRTRGYYISHRKGYINLITKIRKLYDANGRLAGYVMINFDNTEQVLIEQQLIEAKEKAETADRLKSTFLANMSHEIRTPLNAIVGFSGLMASTECHEERLEYQHIIEQNNAQLLQLITDILDLSKIESGTFVFHHQEFDLLQLCDDLVRSMKLKAQPGVTLQLAPGLSSCVITSDRTRTGQILANFVTNAIKFTPNGSIRVGYEVSADENHVRLYVTDTGIGIDADHLPSVFDRFVKLNNFAVGTGLGLSICKSIIEQLGGEIGAESEPNKGSTFWITLPLL